MLRITIIILLLTTSNSYARVFVGASSFYIKSNETNLNFVNEFEQIGKINNLNIGVSEQYNNINISLSTNRILNRDLSREMTDGHNIFINKTKLIYDSIQIGYRLKRLVPNIFVANTMLKRSLFSGRYLVSYQKNHFISYGIGLTYILNKNINISTLYILPIKEVNINGGFGLGFNYLF